MSDEPKAQVTDFGGACPKCTSKNTVMVSLGDPETAKQVSIQASPIATVTLRTHYAFLSCHACQHSWNIPEEPAA
jgi:hypothetical protein